MDSGAQGLHVPWVNSGAEAEAVVRSVKYQPRGVRGLAAIRAADFGQRGTFGEYVRQANAETLVTVHIETVEAVERLPEIVAVEGIDVIFIGPTDLSHSLGVPGEPGHPTVQATMQRIIDAVAPSDKALGIMVSNAQGAREWRERGARYITIGMESLLSPAMRGYLAGVREG
jgi:4-hydroxy-2-oxoheptanedioate aldolase